MTDLPLTNQIAEHRKHSMRNGYTSTQLEMVDVERGSLEITTCNDCPLVTAKCLHTLNKWWLLTRPKTDTNEEVWEKCETDDPRLYSQDLDSKNTKLICELCGLDVT